MKRRLTMALAAGALVAAMVPGVASAGQDDPNRGRCISEMKQALKAVGMTGIELEDFDTIVLGTNGNDLPLPNPEGATLICGFDGNDSVLTHLREGDVFVGGPGDDYLAYAYSGIFIGGTGNDIVNTMYGGNWSFPGVLFLGGPDRDFVSTYWNGTVSGRCLDVERVISGVFGPAVCPAP